MKLRRQIDLSPRRRTVILCLAVAVAGISWYFVWRTGLDAELRDAVETNDVGRVRAALDAGADARATVRFASAAGPWEGFVNSHRRSKVQATPRGPAERKHRLDRVIPLSLLEHAVGAGNVEIATDLLDHGADPNYFREDGSNILFLAARNASSVEIARALLRHGARVDATNRHGDMALHVAAGPSRREIAELLLDNGAAIDAQDTSGQTPLHRAARGCAMPLIRLLLDRGAKIGARDHSGDSVLAVAARYRAAAAVSLLLDRGADPRDLHRTAEDRPLVWIAANGGMPLLRRAWETILSPEQRATEGLDALLAAVMAGNRPSAEYLLSKGVDVKAERTKTGMPGNLVEMTAAHTWFPTPPNAGTSPRMPLLAAAAQARDAELFTLLLDRGAAPIVIDPAAPTPLNAAVSLAAEPNSGRQGPGSYPPPVGLSGSARRSWLPIVVRLLKNGADVRSSDSRGMTPLHFAVADPEVVEFLLAKGAVANARDHWGFTPLMLACSMHNKSVERLIAAGADVNAASNTGVTPLMFAVNGAKPDEIVKTMRTLLKHGANPNLRDKSGKTALAHARPVIQMYMQSARRIPGPGRFFGGQAMNPPWPVPLRELESLLNPAALK